MSKHVHPRFPLVWSDQVPEYEVIETFVCDGHLDRDGRCVKEALRLADLERAYWAGRAGR